MAKLDAPSLEYLLALRSEQEAAYQSQDDQIDAGRAAREMTATIPLPAPYRSGVMLDVHDPTLTDEGFRVPAALGINPATLTVGPPGGKPTEKGQANATLRETWTQAVLDQAGGHMPGLHTFPSVIDAACNDGGGWSRLLRVKDLWDERYKLRKSNYPDDETYLSAVDNAKRAAGPPYIWQACDARSVYPLWSGTGLGEVLEVQQRPISATFRQYRLGYNNDGDIVPDELGQGSNTTMRAHGTTVDFVQHFDETYCTYFVVGRMMSGKSTGQGQIVQQWEHKYGRVPYFYNPGLMMNHWRQRKVGWGVTEAKRSLIELRSLIWTAASSAMVRDLMTSFTRTMADPQAPMMGTDGQPRKREQYEPGVIYDLQPGQVMQPLMHPPVAESFKYMISTIDQAIEKLESPRMNNLTGLEGAGFAINQVLSYERVRFSGIAQNVERMLRELTEFLWSLTRKMVKESIWVYGNGKGAAWIVAGAKDLEDTVDIQWKLNPEQPSDKLILNRYLTERLQNGTMDVDKMIELLGDNPDEVRRGRAIDAIRASPEYKQLLNGQVVQYLGRGDLITQAVQAQQIAQTGNVPPATGSGIVPDPGQMAANPGAQQLPPGPTAGQPQMSMQGGAPGAAQEINQ